MSTEIVTVPSVVSNPRILGGTPVFPGTRVPVNALFDYLEGGHPLPEFLDHFPSVDHERAVAVLRWARDLAMKHALPVSSSSEGNYSNRTGGEE